MNVVAVSTDSCDRNGITVDLLSTGVCTSRVVHARRTVVVPANPSGILMSRDLNFQIPAGQYKLPTLHSKRSSKRKSYRYLFLFRFIFPSPSPSPHRHAGNSILLRGGKQKKKRRKKTLTRVKLVASYS